MKIERNVHSEAANEFEKEKVEEGDVFVDTDGDFWLAYTDQSSDRAGLKILLITGNSIEGYELGAGHDHTLRKATHLDYVTFRGA